MGQWNEADHPREQKTKRFTDKTTLDNGDADLPDNGLTRLADAGIRVDATDYDRSMIALADHEVTVDETGPRLKDGTPLDPQALKDSPYGPRIARRILQTGLDKVKPSQRRRIAQAAFWAVGPKDRRDAIDTSSLVRYFPADKVAQSLQRRRNPEDASRILDRIHAMDMNASANIIRQGFPNSKKTAFTFINRHMKDGGKGSSARWFLRVKFGRPEGAPSEVENRRNIRRLTSMRADPQQQAREFWRICYGDGTKPWPHGNGYAATRVVWSNALTREAAQEFLAMSAGDGRRAKSMYHPEKRRLTAMRATMHALYPELKDDGPDPEAEDRMVRADRRAYRASLHQPSNTRPE